MELMTQLAKLFTGVERLLFDIGAAICVIGILVSGIMHMLAFGSERRKTVANAALASALLGFVLILLALPFTVWLQHLLSGTRP